MACTNYRVGRRKIEIMEETVCDICPIMSKVNGIILASREDRISYSDSYLGLYSVDICSLLTSILFEFTLFNLELAKVLRIDGTSIREALTSSEYG